ncbi:hypothetical protein HDF24_02645 [Mucilaginibacter sp. X4EP1]|uniref:hypothetical protein n=1 Tax=Mucilaginibacter sp. X4EP1 TaxID=2723092 RepID=UPI002166E50C|nr:hypothetical protein [Mucilaginibacter sp. X4EP1]MCS3811918.1 hypothetical protein [Mucilaginibacter sp. X4EP1]
MYKLKFTLLSVAIIISLNAVGQVHLNAHYKSIHYDWIKPSHTLYKQTGFDTSGNITMELVIDHVTKIDSVKKEIAFINTVPFAAGKLLIDSSIDNYSGSARYILVTFPSTKYEYIKYLPASVEAHNIIKGVSSTKTTPMPEGYFDDNSIWDILGYISYKKGVSYQLDCYGTDTHTQVLIPFEIEYLFDEENQERGGAVVSNMVLKVTNPGATAYVWIDKKTHLTTKVYAQGKGYSFSKVAI